MNDARPPVICFGEILWDFLPRGAFPGGAPFNVCYHLHRLGLHAHLVSGVGQDLLGQDLLRRLRDWELETGGITRHPGLPTGHVRATLDAAGNASYEIVTETAWDQIIPGGDTIAAAHRARALVFGSLAQRSIVNRAALDRLLAVLPADALRVFDVNLRQPHDAPELVGELARRCTLLKLNTGEAVRLAGAGPGMDEGERLARVLAGKYGCPMVCVTAGPAGAGLFARGVWHWSPARPVTVRDTVGAGDAFTAGLLAGLLLHGEPPSAALERACRLGEFVATQDGATPPYATDAQGQPVSLPGAASA